MGAGEVEKQGAPAFVYAGAADALVHGADDGFEVQAGRIRVGLQLENEIQQLAFDGAVVFLLDFVFVQPGHGDVHGFPHNPLTIRYPRT
ncbi:hypothetical protein [Corynebacterium sp. Marseille-Q2516]